MERSGLMVNKSKLHLQKVVKREVTNLFESVLDYTQIACSDPNTFKALRSKILRVGNDCIRTISSRLDDYEIEYIANGEEIIKVIKKGKGVNYD